jgi:hypothetical protein
MGRKEDGGRYIKQIDELVGLENEGFLIDALYQESASEDFI